jgi:hypothetical protein
VLDPEKLDPDLLDTLADQFEAASVEIRITSNVVDAAGTTAQRLAVAFRALAKKKRSGALNRGHSTDG